MDKAGFILVTIILKAWKQLDKATGKVKATGESYAYTNTVKETIETFGIKATKNVTLKGQPFGGGNADDSHIVYNWFDDDEYNHEDFVNAYCDGNFEDLEKGIKPQFYYHPITNQFMTVAEYDSMSDDISTADMIREADERTQDSVPM